MRIEDGRQNRVRAEIDLAVAEAENGASDGLAVPAKRCAQPGEQLLHAGQERRTDASTRCLPGNGDEIDVPGRFSARRGSEAAIARADDLTAGLSDHPEVPIRTRENRREIARIRLKIENVSAYALDSGQIAEGG